MRGWCRGLVGNEEGSLGLAGNGCGLVKFLWLRGGEIQLAGSGCMEAGAG